MLADASRFQMMSVLGFVADCSRCGILQRLLADAEQFKRVRVRRKWECSRHQKDAFATK